MSELSRRITNLVLEQADLNIELLDAMGRGDKAEVKRLKGEVSALDRQINRLNEQRNKEKD